jgi:hypothetical protein
VVVNDGLVNSVADIKIINARLNNNPPVANAGEDQTVPTKVWVYPDGSASYVRW